MTSPWRLILRGSAQRGLDAAPEKTAPAVAETLQTIAAEPYRVGKPLKLGFERRWSARRGPYRIVYEVDAPERAVRIVAIGHRAHVNRPPPPSLSPPR